MPVTVIHVRDSGKHPRVVRIDRGTPYGNRHPVRPPHCSICRVQHGRREAIAMFADDWYSEAYDAIRARALAELTGDVALACWCAPKTCHGDVIAKYMNEGFGSLRV